MRNFLFGVIVGTCVTYYYVAGQEAVMDMVGAAWVRASSPSGPPAPHRTEWEKRHQAKQ